MSAIDHGTYRGWNAHRRRGETPCQECKSAQARYNRDWRARTGRTRGEFIAADIIRRYVTGETS